MASNTITLRKGDTAPNIPITCTRSGSAINLTGATVRFIISDPNGSRTNSSHSTCTITSATAGTCTYDLASGDIPTAGTYRGDVEITYAGGEVETQTNSVILVVKEKY